VIGATRAFATLIGAAVAGFLIWLAAQVGDGTTGGYWATYGIIAGAGLVLAVAQWRGRGNPLAMFLVTFIPVLVAVGWVAIAAQPEGNWFRDHVTSWSSSIGIDSVVGDLAGYVGVLAFGLGVVFGLTFEPAMLRRKRRVRAGAGAVPATTTSTAGLPAGERTYDGGEPAYERTAADEPTAAERRELGSEPVVDREAAEREDVVRR
jgi:hypothetical protein